MADELGVANDTIRNHVRTILRRLGGHFNLEAVIDAHERHLSESALSRRHDRLTSGGDPTSSRYRGVISSSLSG